MKLSHEYLCLREYDWFVDHIVQTDNCHIKEISFYYWILECTENISAWTEDIVQLLGTFFSRVFLRKKWFDLYFKVGVYLKLIISYWHFLLTIWILLYKGQFVVFFKYGMYWEYGFFVVVVRCGYCYIKISLCSLLQSWDIQRIVLVVVVDETYNMWIGI